MPFINPKITVAVSDEKKEAIKDRLGQAVSILNKPESFLMVDIEENHEMWFAGNKVDRGAYVAVEIYGNASSDAYDRMTGEICSILGEEADIPADRIYIKYHGVADWGWNGRNF